MSQWYCQIEGSTAGPYELDELRFLTQRGQLTPKTPVRDGLQGEWIDASSIANLFSADKKPNAASMPTRSSGDADPARQKVQPMTPAGQIATASAATIDKPKPRPKFPPRATLSKDETGERRKQVAIGSAVGAGAALLILLLLLLLWPWPKDEVVAGAGGSNGNGDAIGEGTGSGSGNGAGNGSGDGIGDDTGNPLGSGTTGSGPGDNSTAGGESPGDAPSKNSTPDNSNRNAAPEPPEELQGFRPFTPSETPAETPEAKSEQGGGLFGEGGGGSGGGRGSGAELFGVKVRGKIALVCDISGSMSSDFPPLVRALREKFPKNTPLILVGGCAFPAPNPSAPPPQKTTNIPYVGTEFAGDEHVYMASSTTDAIIYAVEELKRDTVMFNNDLQDGGSLSAIDAFEELRKKRRFTLSGRSLNCDAPERLRDFIEKSGGDFKVDPISRQVLPAVPWGS